MSASRLMGHVRDVAPHADAVHHSVLLGASPLPAGTTKLPARVAEQFSSNCTNFGYGWLPDTWCRARGIACDETSHTASYAIGRAIGAKNPHAVLTDDGAMPADVIEGMRSIGIVPESAWSGDDPQHINLRPDFVMLEAACQWRVDGIAIIPETGADRCAAIRHALAQNFPVGFGMQVDESYMGWRGDAVYSSFDPTRNKGGHAQRIIGARPGAFQIAGSWSQWGFVDPDLVGSVELDGSTVWIADSVIGDPMVAYDFYLVSVAPAIRVTA